MLPARAAVTARLPAATSPAPRPAAARLARAIAVLVLASTVTACDRDWIPGSPTAAVPSPSAPTAGPTATLTALASATAVAPARSTPALGAEFHPPDTTTGIPVVDRVLAVFAGEDAAAARALVAMTVVPCTTSQEDAPGRPPCPDGTASGTTVRAFMNASCQPTFTLERGTAEEIAARVIEADMRLFAVFTSGIPTGAERAAAYTVIYAPSRDDLALKIGIDRGGAVISSIECNLPDAAIAGDENFVLPPPGATF